MYIYGADGALWKKCSSRSKNINVMTDSSDIDNEYFGTFSRSGSTRKFKVF